MRVVVVVFMALLSQSCYILGQGAGLLSTYGGAVPIEKALQGELSPPERRLLEDVVEARTFATELGLKTGKNYTTYKRLSRDYLAAVIQGAKEFSVEPYLWSYPIVESLPYRGYFDEAKAKEEASRLNAKGIETLVRRVDAFSTLGFFRDPVFSFFQEWDKPRLIELIIHESVHATLFIPGQGNFNEALATVIARAGTRQWFLSQEPQDLAGLKDWEASLADYKTFARLMAELRESRARLFASGLDPQVMRDQRTTMTTQWLEDYRKTYDQNFQTPVWRDFAPSGTISNAWLAMFSVYEDGTATLEARLAHHSYDISKFIAELKTMPPKTKDPLAWVAALGD